MVGEGPSADPERGAGSPGWGAPWAESRPLPNRAASHVNSKLRESLGGKSSLAMMRVVWGDGAVEKLGLKEIPATEVNLTPSVLLEDDGEARP